MVVARRRATKAAQPTSRISAKAARRLTSAAASSPTRSGRGEAEADRRAGVEGVGGRRRELEERGHGGGGIEKARRRRRPRRSPERTVLHRLLCEHADGARFGASGDVDPAPQAASHTILRFKFNIEEFYSADGWLWGGTKGVYFYRLEVDGEVCTQKAVLLK
jgi:hypothetical protein